MESEHIAQTTIGERGRRHPVVLQAISPDRTDLQCGARFVRAATIARHAEGLV